MASETTQGKKILLLGNKQPNRVLMHVEMVEQIMRDMKYEEGTIVSYDKLLNEFATIVKARQLGVSPKLVITMGSKVAPEKVYAWLLDSWGALYQRMDLAMWNNVTYGGDTSMSFFPIIHSLKELESPREKQIVKAASTSKKFGV